MSNNDNLIPVRSTEEARERGRNGGKKSGEARREKKFITDCITKALNAPIQDDETIELLKSMGINDKTEAMAIAVNMVKAARSDPRAFREILERIEGKVKDRQEVEITTLSVEDYLKDCESDEEF